jgi:hypothetical protein
MNLIIKAYQLPTNNIARLPLLQSHSHHLSASSSLTFPFIQLHLKNILVIHFHDHHGLLPLHPSHHYPLNSIAPSRPALQPV